MRRPSYVFQRASTLGVVMTPMIDVVFLLLVFFVWTASFQVVEYSLPSSLFAASGTGSEVEVDPELEDLDRVVIRIAWQDARPVWMINERSVASLSDVRNTLSGIAAIQSDVPIVLDASPNVPLGHVIDVYDIARLESFSKVQFAVTEGP